VREAELELLKYGRHFRLSDDAKIVVGRTKGENQKMIAHHDPGCDTLMKLKAYPGPTVLITQPVSPTVVAKAAAICAGYSKAPVDQEVDVLVTGPTGKDVIQVYPLSPETVSDLLV
jgi:predicted ribosome quality control (RQC) complex YloA/Tae2 family protein